MARKYLLVMLALLSGACTAEPTTPAQPSTRSPLKPPSLINEVVPPQDVITVVRDVIDGRTVELADGTKVRIALLAPPAACWSESALTFARTTLLARSVRYTGLTPGEVNLEMEDGTDYALLAVRQGVLRSEGVDGGALLSAESEAAAANRGLWGSPCDGKPQALPVPAQPAATTSPPVALSSRPAPPPVQVPTTKTSPPPAARPCAVAYRITGQWPDGFQASVTVRNTGVKETNGWTLRWSFTKGETIRDMWNASPKQSRATVDARNADYNPRIAPDGSVQIGFNGNSRGSNAVPTAFTLNGVSCSVD